MVKVLELTKGFVQRLSKASLQSIAEFRTVKEPPMMMAEANSQIDQVLLEASRLVGREKTLGELLNSPADNALMSSLVALGQVS